MFNYGTTLAVICIYFLILFAISWLTSRRNSASSSDFFRGDRKSPWYIVAISMIGTSISGVTFISVPGMVAASQFSYLQMVLGFVAGYLVIAYVLLPLYYRINMKSVYGYLEQRFGQRSYRTGAVFFLISKVPGCGVRMYLTALVLQLVLFNAIGVPFVLNVAVTMVIVYLYTFRGGVKTIIWTDMIQTLSLIAAVVLSIFYVGKALGYDFTAMCSTISTGEMSRVWFFDDVKDTRYFWKQFLAGMFTTIAMTGLDQDMMQKNLSCKNLKEARKNVISYGVMFLPINLLFLALGSLLYIFAGHSGIQVGKPDELFPAIACGVDPATGSSYLPAVVSIFFILGLISAAFSSAGSALTALTTSFTVDILQADRHMDESKLKRTRNIVHACNAVVMIGIICLFKLIGNGSVINAVYMVASYTYGPLLGLFTFGMLFRRRVRDSWVPFICLASPAICYVLAQNSAAWFGGYHIGFELLLINAAITMAGLALSSIGKKQQAC